MGERSVLRCVMVWCEFEREDADGGVGEGREEESVTRTIHREGVSAGVHA